MIRQVYASNAQALKDLLSNLSDDEDVTPTSSIAEGGKRKMKFEYTDVDLQTLSKLEDLGLDSDDEDILLLDDEESGQEFGEVSITIDKKRPPGENTTKKEDAEVHQQVTHRIVETTPSTEPIEWVRSIGLTKKGSAENIQMVITRMDPDLCSRIVVSGKTESVMAETIRNLLHVYHKKRHEVVTEDGIVSTPLHVVKTLAISHGETLHCEAVSFPHGYHRVELYSGTVRGIGEATTKRIAAQMAAVDMMERIQLSKGTVKVPTACFLPGWLMSNKIFSDLKSFCRNNGLAFPKILSTATAIELGYVDHRLPKYRAQCWVGEKMTVGESEVDIFARREAARQMFSLISGYEYKHTPFAIGIECKSATDLMNSGFQLIMSDYKKMWLLQNRVENNRLVIPPYEKSMDEPFDLEELEKEIGKADQLALNLMNTKQNITIQVNKKIKLDDGEPETTERRVSIEPKRMKVTVEDAS